MMNYIVFDTETTGLKRKFASLNEAASFSDLGDEIIQIGGLILDDKAEPIKAFCHYCDTVTSSSSSDSFRVHGINSEHVRDEVGGMFVDEILWKWCPEFFAPSVTFVGYNGMFDIQMVAQGLRNFPYPFVKPEKLSTRLKKSGRWVLDVMDYLPEKRKLVQQASLMGKERDKFFEEYGGRLTLETNAPRLLEQEWNQAHNSLFDSIETYLLFKHKVWQVKVFGR